MLPDDEKTFLLFALFHLYLYARVLQSADIVIDVNAVANDATANREAADRIAAATGVRLDLSDCSENVEFSLVEFRSKSDVVDAVDQFVKLIGIEINSPEVMDRVVRIKDEMLAEWQRSEFYAGRLRKHFTGQIASLGATCELLRDGQRQAEERAVRSETEAQQQAAALADLRAQTERQDAELAAFRAEVERRDAELAAWRTEVERRDAELSWLHTENDALKGQIDAVQNNYNTYRARHRGLRQFWRWGDKGN